MTAGTGIIHSEYNPSEEKPVHFLQIWFLPERRGLTPSWEQKKFPSEQKRNRLLPVVSGRPAEGALYIHQDVTVYLSRLEAGRQIHHRQEAGRRMYLFVIDGAVSVDGEHPMKAGDSARITGLFELTVSTGEGAEFMLMDLA
ncbi:hypothetical protein PLACP1_11880 [Planifilum fimeticola]